MTEPKKEGTVTREDVERQLTEETRQRGFIEYPKCLHHPDGRDLVVHNKEQEEDALRGEWCPTPEEAQKVKAKRDAADKKREQEMIKEEQKEADRLKAENEALKAELEAAKGGKKK